VKRRERETLQQEFLLGQLTAIVANFSMCRPKEPFSPRDFMPSEFGKVTSPSKTRKRRKRTVIANELRLTMAHFMRTQNA
jgi:hypothetical protein